MKRTRFLLLGLAVAFAGCASTGDTDGDQPQRDANRITLEEITVSYHTDAFRLVEALRPRWLASRGPMSFSDPDAGRLVVYLDGTRYGWAENLRELQTMNLERLEYLDGVQASARYGFGHSGGAILVTTRLR